MVKILMLLQLYNFTDNALGYQLLDRGMFLQFRDLLTTAASSKPRRSRCSVTARPKPARAHWCSNRYSSSRNSTATWRKKNCFLLFIPSAFVGDGSAARIPGKSTSIVVQRDSNMTVTESDTARGGPVQGPRNDAGVC